MRTKCCYKYKTIRVTLRFSKAYEQIYKGGGVNVSITRKDRKFFFRMFDSHLSYNQVRAKFRWQASKRLEDNAPDDDNLVIKDLVNRYNAFFWKNRVNGTRFFFYVSTKRWI